MKGVLLKKLSGEIMKEELLLGTMYSIKKPLTFIRGFFIL
jgi:hypothetical protein